LPICDLPQHAAAIATLAHWSDPVWRASDTYTLQLGHSQYVLFYVAGAALARALGSAERALLVLLTCVALAFPFGLRALLKSLRRDEALALFGCPLFWTYPTTMGFLNFVAAIPLACWALSLVVSQSESPTPRRSILLALASLTLLFLHPGALLFFLVASVLAYCLLSPAIVEPGRGARLRHLARWWLWSVPVLATAAIELASSPVLQNARFAPSIDRLRFESPAQSLATLPRNIFDVLKTPGPGLAWLGLCAAWFALLVPFKSSTRDGARRRAFVLLTAAWAAALYFALPESVSVSMACIHQRYAVLAVAMLALLPPARFSLRRNGAAIALLASTALIVPVEMAHSFRAFDAEVGAFDAVIAKAEPGRRMIGLVYDADSKVTRFPPFLHFAAYYRARYGGIAEFSFMSYPHMPLQYKAGVAPPARPDGAEWMPSTYRPEGDGAYYDYVLVHLRQGAIVKSRLEVPGMSFGWRLAAQEGPWSLYAKVSRESAAPDEAPRAALALADPDGAK
jgi:hypothetical protein